MTKEALAYKGSGVGVLPKGKRVKLETMLNGLLLPSGNDAAIALAQRMSGHGRAFVAAHERARRRPRAARARASARPSGFEDAGNHSCAHRPRRDGARASSTSPRLARIVARRRAVLPFPIKGGRMYLFNNNPLLRTGYPGTIGIKTGYTDAAGRCLVAPRAATGAGWAWCSCTRPTRASRRRSCSTAASRAGL